MSKKEELYKEAKIRVQQLEMEKKRLKKRYNQSLKEVNNHIKNCTETLNKMRL